MTEQPSSPSSNRTTTAGRPTITTYSRVQAAQPLYDFIHDYVHRFRNTTKVHTRYKDAFRAVERNLPTWRKDPPKYIDAMVSATKQLNMGGLEVDSATDTYRFLRHQPSSSKNMVPHSQQDSPSNRLTASHKPSRPWRDSTKARMTAVKSPPTQT